MTSAVLLHHETRETVQRRAEIKVALLLGATVLLVGFFVVIGLRQDMTDVIYSAGALAAFGVVAALGLALLHRGRVEQGLWLVLAGMFIVWPVTVLFIADIGILWGLALPLLVVLLVADLLPARQTVLAVLTAVLVGVFTGLLDIYGLDNRLQVPEAIAWFVPAMVLLIATIYAVLLARQFKYFGMRAKLIAATVIVAIVAVVVVTIVVSLTTRNALTNQVGSDLENLAESQALAIGELMSRQVNILEALALNQAVKGALTARRQLFADQSAEEIAAVNARNQEIWAGASAMEPLVLTILNNSTSGELFTFQQTFPDHTRLILADQFGSLVAASGQPDAYYFGEEDWWISAYAGGFGAVHISEPYSDENSDAILVDVAVPVKAADGTGRNTIAGVLFSSFSLDPMIDILRQAEFGETGALEIHFADHVEIDTLDESIAALSFVEETERNLVEALWLSGEDFIGGIYRGEPSLVSQAQVNTLSHEPRVDRLGWALVVFQPEAEALASVAQQQQINILLGLSIVLVASLAAAFVAQELAGPITRLTNTAVLVAKGDLSARAPVESNDEIGTLAVSFNQMTGELQRSIEGLEQRVAERTRALAASVEVSRSLSTILDPDELIVEVVEQVRDAFDYYYVQIYLLDETQSSLVLMAGTGEAGQLMLARQHRLDAGRGLVGRAAISNRPVFIPNVVQSSAWQPNPLLPDTRSEIAVPIAVADDVLGVLDVQDDVADRLTAEDVRMLQSVGYQVAIAIQNARTFSEAKKRADREATINTINQKIQNATSIDAVLQIAAEELGQALGGRTTSIELQNPVHKTNGNGHQKS